MTLETCKKRLELAKTDAERLFWEERIARKIAKFSKYAQVAKVAKPLGKEVKKNEKSKG